MLNINCQSLGVASAMLVRDLPPHENSNNSKISPHWVGLIKQIDRSSLEMMLAYLKKHREEYIEIKKLERIKKLSLFEHCLLLTLLKINQNQLTSKCLSAIGNIFSHFFQRSQKFVNKWTYCITSNLI
jgi:hypothetical protein